MTRDFWARADRSNPTGCWPWLAGKTGAGYGAFWLDGHQRLAHRLAWSLSGRTIDPEQVLDHICRNRACVNPSHLRQVSQRSNAVENSVSRSALNANKTHCNRGHLFDDTNTGSHHGARYCRTCYRAGARAYKARRNLKEPGWQKKYRKVRNGGMQHGAGL